MDISCKSIALFDELMNYAENFDVRLVTIQGATLE